MATAKKTSRKVATKATKKPRIRTTSEEKKTMKAEASNETPKSRFTGFSYDPKDLVIVGLDDRKEKAPLCDERNKFDVSESLVRNIKEFGILEPIICRINGERVEVVDGRQRVRAAREANVRLDKEGLPTLRVPVILKNGDDNRMMGIMVSANEQRRDNTVMMKARTAARYIDLGRSVNDAALVCGVSVQTVSTWLKLVSLAREVQDAIDSGQISASQALRRCYGKPHEKQLEAIQQRADKPKLGRPNGPSRPTLRKIVSELDGLVDLGGFHPEFVKALRFVLGEIDPSDLGLSHLIPTPPKKREKPLTLAEILGDDEDEDEPVEEEDLDEDDEEEDVEDE